MEIHGITKEQMKKEIIEMALVVNKRDGNIVGDDTVIYFTKKLMDIVETKNELHTLYNAYEAELRNK